MSTSVEKACEKATDLINKYNPNGVVPFPFEDILKDYNDLEINYSSVLPSGVSGVVVYVSGDIKVNPENVEAKGENKNDKYKIFINSNSKPTRQYFTLAHELGHYLLHKGQILSEEMLIDKENSLDGANMLFRLDNAKLTSMEREANNFAACLLMPEVFIRKAWSELEDIEACARVFQVSISAMSIRLERLNLIS